MVSGPAVAQDAGRLVIVGGGLSPQNETIFRAFLDGLPSDGPIGVVPLASGVPERSGPLTAQDIQQFAENPERVFDTQIVHTRPEMARDRAVAERLAGCVALWFTGGDQRRILANLRHVEAGRDKFRDTPAYAAVLEVLRRGGTVGGTSAGAAMMSRVMIRGGSSGDAMLLGPTDDDDGAGVAFGRGMELFPYGIVDQHFLRRGRFGRLLVALEATDTPLGFGVSEDRGMAVDLAAGRIVSVGGEAITLIDRREATRDGHARGNLRVSLLGAGDRIDGPTGSITVAPDKQRLDGPARDTGVSIAFPEMWDRYVVAQMIKALAANPARPVTSDDASFDYRMSADDLTAFYVGQGDTGLSAVGVRLDITPRRGLDEKIAERRQELAEREAE
jgi:cyanophycinase